MHVALNDKVVLRYTTREKTNRTLLRNTAFGEGGDVRGITISHVAHGKIRTEWTVVRVLMRSQSMNCELADTYTVVKQVLFSG